MHSGLSIKAFHHLETRYSETARILHVHENVDCIYIVYLTSLCDRPDGFLKNSCCWQGQADDGKQPWQGVCFIIFIFLKQYTNLLHFCMNFSYITRASSYFYHTSNVSLVAGEGEVQTRMENVPKPACRCRKRL